jgi:hypothetical protein
MAEPPPTKRPKTEVQLTLFSWRSNSNSAAFTRNGASGPEREVPATRPTFPCPWPGCFNAFLTQRGATIHGAFCEESPSAVADAALAAAEAASFASLFPLGRAPLAPAEDVGYEADDGRGDGEEEGQAVDAMELDEPADAPEPGQHAVKRRHSYSTRTKYLTLQAFDKVRTALLTKHPEPSVTRIRVGKIVSINTGIPFMTLAKWVAKREKITQLYLDKKRHLRHFEKIGSGRKPLFPKSEAAVATLVRDRRKQSLAVTKTWVLDRFKEEANRENREAAEKCKFSADMFLAMLRRCGLALRLPSCTKAMSLDNGVLAGRGWLRWLLRLTNDKLPDGIARALSFHPVEGRFILRRRLNKDEVKPVSSRLYLITAGPTFLRSRFRHRFGRGREADTCAHDRRLGRSNRDHGPGSCRIGEPARHCPHLQGQGQYSSRRDELLQLAQECPRHLAGECVDRRAG